MRVTRPLLPIALLAFVILVGGCGSSDSDESATESSQPTPSAPAGSAAKNCMSAAGARGLLRATGVSCDEARAVVAEWSRMARCASPAGASRYACTVGDYRCLGATTDRGVAVACARPQRSIAFIAEPR